MRSGALPGAVGHVPGGVAVAGLQLAVAVLVDHDVTDLGMVVQPLGVRIAHPGAAVADVGAPLAAHRPARRVQELTAVSEPHGPLGLDVVVVGVALLDADRAGAHVVHALPAHDDLDAVPGGHRRLAGGDRDRPQHLAVPADRHLVAGDIHGADHLRADVEVRRALGCAPDSRLQLDAGQVGGDLHLGVGRPVVLRAPLDLLAGDPAPASLDVLGGLDREGGLNVGPVLGAHRAGEVDHHRHADTDHPAVTGLDVRAAGAG